MGINMEIPKQNIDVVSLIDAHHESIPDEPRSHMGCSQLGHSCDRYLWLNFRWAVREKFKGRILRLFRRGHNEEATVVADLKAIGCDVQRTGDNQLWVTFGKHVAGSVDGIIESGLPEAPKTRHVLEIKTHSKKSFDKLEAEGVEKSKPMHYAQMQLYMAGTGCERALYISVCKDDDRLYAERIHFDKSIAEWLINRGQKIALAERMPDPITRDSTWYECKYCPAWDICFGSKCTKEVNCRTCAHSTPTESSTWTCARWDNAEIPVEAQREGCECHVLHPDLVPYELIGTQGEWVAVYNIGGKNVANGEPDANVYSSREILANPNACANPDEFTEHARIEMGARIEGDVK